MHIVIRILLIMGAVISTAFMIRRISLGRLKIEYLLYWLFFSLILLLMAFFPNLFSIISNFLGFQSPINMIYLIIICLLIAKLFFVTMQISKLENKIDNLTEEVSLDKVKDMKARKNSN